MAYMGAAGLFLTPESLPNNCPAYSKKFFLDKNYSVDIIEKQYEIGFQIQIKIYRIETDVDMWASQLPT